MGSHLAKLPKEAGPLVYSHLLTLLVKGKQSVVLPDEILALADASPGEPSDEQLALLGQLLAQSRDKLGIPKAMLADLSHGTKRLGGKDAKQRLAAARLLSAAGMIDPAVSYLPALAEVRKSKDPAVVNLYAACQQSLAEKDHDDGRLGLAWDLSHKVLETPQLADEPRDEAVQRLVALIPAMPEEVVAEWVKHWARGAEKATVPVCPSGPEPGTDAKRWSSHKTGLSPFPRACSSWPLRLSASSNRISKKRPSRGWPRSRPSTGSSKGFWTRAETIRTGGPPSAS